eukprot:2914483-Alexandrium_andersonii.AAC.1
MLHATTFVPTRALPKASACLALANIAVSTHDHAHLQLYSNAGAGASTWRMPRCSLKRAFSTLLRMFSCMLTRARTLMLLESACAESLGHAAWQQQVRGPLDARK